MIINIFLTEKVLTIIEDAFTVQIVNILWDCSQRNEHMNVSTVKGVTIRALDLNFKQNLVFCIKVLKYSLIYYEIL